MQENASATIRCQTVYAGRWILKPAHTLVSEEDGSVGCNDNIVYTFEPFAVEAGHYRSDDSCCETEGQQANPEIRDQNLLPLRVPSKPIRLTLIFNHKASGVACKIHGKYPAVWNIDDVQVIIDDDWTFNENSQGAFLASDWWNARSYLIGGTIQARSCILQLPNSVIECLQAKKP